MGRNFELRGLVELRRYLDGFWEDVLQAFKAEAEKTGSRQGEEDDGREQR